jgi:hypothetical protein
MNGSLARKIPPFFPVIFLVAGALCVLDRTTAALDREDLLGYGYEAATFALFAARGTGVALTVIAAGWLVWGAGRLVARLTASVSVLATVLVLWHRLYVPESPWNVLSQHISSLLTFVGSGVLLAGASRLGLCFASAANAADRGLQKWQVSILDLLAITSGAAILLAATRGYVPTDRSSWRLSQDEVVWALLQAAANLLIVATVVTCFHERRPWWRNVMISAGLSAAVAAMHVFALSRLLELPLLPLDPALLARGIHHAVNFAWLICGLGALRLAGFRFCRVPLAAPEPRLEIALEPSATA